jgi:alpha-tubulin suppressor-like RCC1 family protein
VAARAASAAAARRKRPWDPSFLGRLDRAAAGDPIRFELVNGETAVGAVRHAERDGRSLIYVSGELTAPEGGRFFFQKQTRPGRAGDYVGVVEFPGAGRAYRIEPSGPAGSPELVERSLGEVLCQQLPRPKDRSTNQVEGVPPLDPANFPGVPTPPYQNGIVSLESLYGATAVLYMDFQGGYTPTWGGISYAAAGLSNDQIRALWQQVAGDFMPFNVNVTTDLGVYQNAPPGSRQRVIITTTDAAMPDAGGVAYIGSFNWTGDTPCWVFVTDMGYCAQACSHELGHTLGLSHDGQQVGDTHIEYFEGQGAGAVGWVPVMGVPYYKTVIQWSNGGYPFANNPEDQVAMISSQNNNVAYRTDATGGTMSTSRFLETYADGSAGAEGVIERTAATNAFQFTTGGGPVSLRADPQNAAGPLALEVALCDTNNLVLALGNPQGTLWAAVSNNLPAGTYIFCVIGAGRNDPMSNGFPPYGSLGYYSITGLVANARVPDRFSIQEHSPNETLVGIVRANNTGGDALAYSIVSGNAGGTFAIDNAGTLTVADNRLLDYPTLAAQTTLAVQFDLLVDITDPQNPGLTETGRRVVVAVTPALTPPVILEQPQSLSIVVGATATFSVTATGDEPLYPLSYQWWFNGASISNATAPELVLASAQFTDAGGYTVTVTNATGATTSAIASLAVLPAPPSITVQPSSQGVVQGAEASFLVQAIGTAPLAYQWELNGATLAGETNPAIELTNVQPADVGGYQVIVINAAGSATSSLAALALVPVVAWGWDADGQTDVPAGASNVVQISAGAMHNLALLQDGSVIAWGSGEATNVPAGLPEIVSVAAGGTFSLALSSNGMVFCWGTTDAGQTEVPPNLSNVVAVAAGGSHSLALKSDGTVAAWGLNNLGQATVPSWLTNAAAIAAGADHSLALSGQGTVFAWGDNRHGQTNAPPYLADVVAIAAGNLHCLALLGDGTVTAWGDNSYGQTSVPAGLSNVVAIAAGGFHSLALKADGTMVGWGAGSTASGVYPDLGQAMAPANQTRLAALSAGTAHSLGLVGWGAPFITQPPAGLTVYRGTRAAFRAAASGALPLSYQWQLDGTNLPGATSQVLILPEAGQAGDCRVVVSNAFGVAVSAAVTLTLVDQPPYLISQPQSQTSYLGGQVNLQVLAAGSGPLAYQWYADGASLPGATNTTLTLSGFSEYQTEDYYVVVSNPLGTATSALASVNPTQVLAWGAGTDRSGNPNFGQSMVPAGLSGVARVAGGAFHSLALKADGTVVAWGAGATVATDPDFGQSVVPAGLQNVVAIAAGGYHSLALRADGTIVAWGLGQYGATSVPEGLNNVVAIAAGDYHSLALKGDGSVVVWGGTSAVNIVPTTATNLIAIASAGANILGLRSDGTLVRWGQTNTVPFGSDFVGVAAGSGGCLALESGGKLVSLDSNDLPPNLPAVRAMAAGFFHDLALKPDGTVLSWGLLAASLGMGDAPAGLTNVIDIACGDYHNLAAMAAPVATIQSPPPDRAAELGGTTLFSVVASGAPPLSYRWQFNGTDLPGATGQRFRLSGLQATNAGGYRVVVSSLLGMATSRVAQLVILPSLAQALNATGLVWAAAGDAGWWVETNVTHDGVAAAQSAHISTGQQSSIWTYADGPGTLRFWWKVSSEQDYDFLFFAFDGMIQTEISGEMGWQLLSYSVPAGTHTLQWIYAKTSSSATGGGEDTAWLDQVTFIPNLPVITLQPVGQTVSMGAQVVLKVAASGPSPISYQWLKDGTNLPGATSTNLVLTKATRRTSGTYAAAASNPGGSALSSNASVYVRVPERLTSPSISSGGSFMLFSGDADGGTLLPGDLAAFQAAASTNLEAWTPLTNSLSITNGLLLLVDPEATNYERRFYRIDEAPGP